MPINNFNVTQFEFQSEVLHRVVIRGIADNFNISYASTQHILVKVLGMKRVTARLAIKKPKSFAETTSN